MGDLVVEEPSQEIEADFALGLPDLRMDFGAPQGDEECEDEAVTEPVAAPEATEECEEPITTEEPVAAPTEAECVDEPIETTEAAPEPTTAGECEEEIETAAAPEAEMRIESAAVVEDIKMYGEEHMIPEIEECEE